LKLAVLFQDQTLADVAREKERPDLKGIETQAQTQPKLYEFVKKNAPI